MKQQTHCGNHRTCWKHHSTKKGGLKASSGRDLKLCSKNVNRFGVYFVVYLNSLVIPCWL